MWLSVSLWTRENLTPVGTHRIRGKCGYMCLAPNAVLRVAVCSAQDALLGIVSIYEFPTPYSSMFCSGCPTWNSIYIQSWADLRRVENSG